MTNHAPMRKIFGLPLVVQNHSVITCGEEIVGVGVSPDCGERALAFARAVNGYDRLVDACQSAARWFEEEGDRLGMRGQPGLSEIAYQRATLIRAALDLAGPALPPARPAGAPVAEPPVPRLGPVHFPREERSCPGCGASMLQRHKPGCPTASPGGFEAAYQDEAVALVDDRKCTGCGGAIETLHGKSLKEPDRWCPRGNPNTLIDEEDCS